MKNVLFSSFFALFALASSTSFAGGHADKAQSGTQPQSEMMEDQSKPPVEEEAPKK